MTSGQAAFRGPAGQLVAGGKLQLAQYRRDVALDGLARDEQLAGDLLVGVALSDQPQDLALPGGQLIEFRVEGRLDVIWCGRSGEGVEHEAGQPVREHRVAVRDPPDRVRQVAGGDRLGHVAPRARPDHRDHVLRRVRGRQREELDLGMLLLDLGDDGLAAAAGQVHVEQDHVGQQLADQFDGRSDVCGLADHFHPRAKFGAHARAEQAVVVDQDHARHVAHRRLVSSATSAAAGLGSATVSLDRADRGIVNVTFVPSPGADCTVASPPCLLILPWMDSATPLRSPGTAAGSKPLPRSRTATLTLSGSTSANTEITAAPDHLAAFTVASLAAASRAFSAGSSGQSPTVTTSTGTPCLASTSCWISRTPSTTEETSVSPGARPSNSQERSSRSWARASCTTACGSSARRWISASVCSTESCMWAAMSARASARARACRSDTRARADRSHQGPSSSTIPAVTNRKPPSGASS